jgi:hypothetical protein
MTPDERAGYRLEDGLGGPSPSVYERVVRKVWGKDHGYEILAALRDNPATAVPIVLSRLKQKDEEWKRAEREWNKVWREVVSPSSSLLSSLLLNEGRIAGLQKLLPRSRPPGHPVQGGRQEGLDDVEVSHDRDRDSPTRQAAEALRPRWPARPPIAPPVRAGHARPRRPLRRPQAVLLLP